jgi:hypothetical protein
MVVEKEDQEKLLNLKTIIKKSDKNYDWLGHGMYFWENNEKRALDWAKMKKIAGTLNKPSSVGAVVNLGYCLDLLDVCPKVNRVKNTPFIQCFYEFFSFFKFFLYQYFCIHFSIPSFLEIPKFIRNTHFDCTFDGVTG